MARMMGMLHDDDARAALLVRSTDGTEIAVWTSGAGPPLLLVHGVAGDHRRWAPLLPYLEPHATVHALDRRGRGASTDGPSYDVRREYEDVAAVIDAVAQRSGASVDVYGHSFGGLCAFGAATRTSNIRRLVLYEGWPAVTAEGAAMPPEIGSRIDALVAAGDREAAVELLFRELLDMPQAELDALRAQPSWEARVAAAPTLVRELRATDSERLVPAEAARVSVPTLLLTGDQSPDPVAADIHLVVAALPDARIGVLEGQQHVADVLAPQLVAERIISFLRT